MIALIIIILCISKISNQEEAVNKIVETKEIIAEVESRTILTKLTAPGEVSSAVN